MDMPLVPTIDAIRNLQNIQTEESQRIVSNRTFTYKIQIDDSDRQLGKEISASTLLSLEEIHGEFVSNKLKKSFEQLFKGWDFRFVGYIKQSFLLIFIAISV